LFANCNLFFIVWCLGGVENTGTRDKMAYMDTDKIYTNWI